MSDKVSSIIEEIKGLSLLEASELERALKKPLASALLLQRWRSQERQRQVTERLQKSRPNSMSC